MKGHWAVTAMLASLSLAGTASGDDSDPAKDKKARLEKLRKQPPTEQAAGFAEEARKSTSAAVTGCATGGACELGETLAELQEAAAAAQKAERGAGLIPSSFSPMLETLRSEAVQATALTDGTRPQKLAEVEAKANELADAVENAAKNADKARTSELEALAAKADRLLNYGFTVGVSAAVHLPIQYTNHRLARLDHPVGGVMPYVAFVPAFWRSFQPQKAYCAAQWSASSEQIEAAAALGAKTERKAIEVQREALDELKGEGLTESKLNEQREELDDRELAIIASQGAYKCFWHKIGFYVGYPAMFNASATVQSRTLRDHGNRDVQPVASLGAAILPNAMVAILLGPAVSLVSRDDETKVTMWTMVLGVGGNADIVNLFQ